MSREFSIPSTNFLSCPLANCANVALATQSRSSLVKNEPVGTAIARWVVARPCATRSINQLCCAHGPHLRARFSNETLGKVLVIKPELVAGRERIKMVNKGKKPKNIEPQIVK